MEVKPISLLLGLITINGIILALFDHISFFAFIISLILLVFSLISLIGILLDSKFMINFENSLLNRVNITIFLMSITLINTFAIFIYFIKNKLMISFTSSEVDVYIISILIVSLTFILYLKKFREEIVINYLKNKVRLVVYPHKINATTDKEIEITIINNSFIDLNLDLSIMPENISILGQHKITNKSSPYILRLKKGKHINQLFQIKTYQPSTISISYNGKLLVNSRITCFD